MASLSLESGLYHGSVGTIVYLFSTDVPVFVTTVLVALRLPFAALTFAADSQGHPAGNPDHCCDEEPGRRQRPVLCLVVRRGSDRSYPGSPLG